MYFESKRFSPNKQNVPIVFIFYINHKVLSGSTVRGEGKFSFDNSVEVVSCGRERDDGGKRGGLSSKRI